MYVISVKVSAVSTTFALRAFGTLGGSLVSSWLLDRLHHSTRILSITAAFAVIALTSLALPFSPDLLTMQVHMKTLNSCKSVVSLRSKSMY